MGQWQGLDNRLRAATELHVIMIVAVALILRTNLDNEYAAELAKSPDDPNVVPRRRPNARRGRPKAWLQRAPSARGRRPLLMSRSRALECSAQATSARARRDSELRGRFSDCVQKTEVTSEAAEHVVDVAASSRGPPLSRGSHESS